MSDAAPQSGGMDRRKFLVGGATAFAAGALVPNAFADSAAGESSTLFAADFVGRVSGSEADVVPLATDNVVRVAVDGKIRNFARNQDVAVLLPANGGMVDVESIGDDGPVSARGITRLVMGEESDLARVRAA